MGVSQRRLEEGESESCEDPQSRKEALPSPGAAPFPWKPQLHPHLLAAVREVSLMDQSWFIHSISLRAKVSPSGFSLKDN